MKKAIIAAILFGLAVAATAGLTSYEIWNGPSRVNIYDVNTPAGHQCTVAFTNDYRSGVAMHCWK